MVIKVQYDLMAFAEYCQSNNAGRNKFQ